MGGLGWVKVKSHWEYLQNAKNLVTVLGEGLLGAITGVCDQFSPKLLYLKEKLFGLNLVACNIQQIIWLNNLSFTRYICSRFQ